VLSRIREHPDHPPLFAGTTGNTPTVFYVIPLLSPLAKGEIHRQGKFLNSEKNIFEVVGNGFHRLWLFNGFHDPYFIYQSAKQ